MKIKKKNFYLIIHYFYFRYTAVSVVEMDFDRIDINQCPWGEGNKAPNKFRNTARCKPETTEVNSNVKIIIKQNEFLF